jgi:hypothetical protein
MVLNLVAERLQSQLAYANYGAHINEELSNLPPMMVTFCQRVINGAIFEAKCRNLNQR